MEMYCDVVARGTADAPTQACVRSFAMQPPCADGSDANGSDTDDNWSYMGGVKTVRFLTKVFAKVGMLPTEHSEPKMGHPLRNPLAPAQRDVIRHITLFAQQQTGFFAVLQPLPTAVQRSIAECARVTSSARQAKRLAEVAAGGPAPSNMHALQVEALQLYSGDRLVEVADPSNMALQVPAPVGCLHSQGYMLWCSPDDAAIQIFEQAQRLYRDGGSGVEVPDVCVLLLPERLATGLLRSTRATDAGSGDRHMFPKTPLGG